MNSRFQPSSTATPPRFGPAFAAAGALLLVVVLTACSGITGTASPVSVKVPSTPTSSGPPVCDDAHGESGAFIAKTPTGTPIITLTQGVNAWIANWAVEPLGVAVYADGTAISAKGTGERSEALPPMTIGFVPSCTLAWVHSEIRQLAVLDMGQAGISDQGTTTLTFTPSTGDPIKISIYALGAGDRYATTGIGNRARFSRMLTAIEAPLASAANWTPDRLRIVEAGPGSRSDTTLTWPGPVPVTDLLTQHRGTSRCGVVSGPAANVLLKTLGGSAVLSEWSDAGRQIVLQVGALVPGQLGCTDTD